MARKLTEVPPSLFKQLVYSHALRLNSLEPNSSPSSLSSQISSLVPTLHTSISYKAFSLQQSFQLCKRWKARHPSRLVILLSTSQTTNAVIFLRVVSTSQSLWHTSLLQPASLYNVATHYVHPTFPPVDATSLFENYPDENNTEACRR